MQVNILISDDVSGATAPLLLEPFELGTSIPGHLENMNWRCIS